MSKTVRLAFESHGLTIPITDLLPLKQVKLSLKSNAKYQKVLSSVREIGIIEPLVVFPQDGAAGTYLILDGHLRLEALKELGQTHAPCLVSTDDEAYTYNRRVSKIAPIQEHLMILKAIKSGISEERIAKVLNIDVPGIRQKRDLLNGICNEAAEILKTKQLAPNVFPVLRKMKPMRQIEVAELLVTANNFSVPYTKALLAATPHELLVEPDKHKTVDGLTPEQMARMTKEMETLQRDLRVIEESHGNQVLNLVLARGYLTKLFNNDRIVRYLNLRHTELFAELQTVLAGTSLES
jgi:ParB-like chromosome segregation protein Spo0J